MKLKTLKDLKLGYEGYAPEDEAIRWKLKAEAIKWHEEYQKFLTPSTIKVSQFIRKFFNITEEDLK